ncbi:MAG: tetratricopeptide repeat protein [Gammaproteobacteria bacterium]|nr:tetratricopeptide repeat protein [Gammaproteobacteria bacterium]
MNPQDPSAQVTLEPAVVADFMEALTAMRAGDRVKARRLLETLSQKQPMLAGPQLNLGILQLAEQDIEGAEQRFRRILEQHPRHPVASNQLGLLLRRQGRFNEAEQAYQDALLTRPDYPLAHRNLGILYDLYLQQPEKALFHYQRYQTLTDPADTEVTGWIADLELRAERVGAK